MSSAIRKPGSASTTPRPGNRIRRPISCWRRRFCRPKISVSAPAASCCPITTRPNSRTASRCSITSPSGRLNFGVAASGLPSDWAMFNVDGMSGQNRDMTREALEIILKMWTEDAPWTYNGKFWTVNKPDTMFDFLKPHLKPMQAPHPPIGVAGLSKGSDTLKLAGERGYIPMSLNLNPAYVGSHWESVEIGAARTGRKPKRSDWRLVREVFIADTDEEAWRLSVGDMMGRMMGEYFLPAARPFRFQGLPQGHARRAGQRRHRRILRAATTGSSARLRPSPRRSKKSITRSAASARSGVRLRLQAQAGGLAQFAAPVEAGSDAAAEASRRGPDQGGVRCIVIPGRCDSNP